jgi:uncharacterized coiled-coil protein SlyX
MALFDHLWDRPLKLMHTSRRAQRRQATLEARIMQLETEVSELETVCKTLLGVVREAKLMTDDRVEALLKVAAQQASKAKDPDGDKLERRPPM